MFRRKAASSTVNVRRRGVSEGSFPLSSSDVASSSRTDEVDPRSDPGLIGRIVAVRFRCLLAVAGESVHGRSPITRCLRTESHDPDGRHPQRHLHRIRPDCSPPARQSLRCDWNVTLRPTNVTPGLGRTSPCAGLNVTSGLDQRHPAPDQRHPAPEQRHPAPDNVTLRRHLLLVSEALLHTGSRPSRSTLRGAGTDGGPPGTARVSPPASGLRFSPSLP